MSTIARHQFAWPSLVPGQSTNFLLGLPSTQLAQSPRINRIGTTGPSNVHRIRGTVHRSSLSITLRRWPALARLSSVSARSSRLSASASERVFLAPVLPTGRKSYRVRCILPIFVMLRHRASRSNPVMPGGRIGFRVLSECSQIPSEMCRNACLPLRVLGCAGTLASPSEFWPAGG